jgi:hypothetical protein
MSIGTGNEKAAIAPAAFVVSPKCLYCLSVTTDPHIPILHVWIRGNGEAVQALWTDDKGGGCYRCLLVPSANAHRQERYRVLKNPSVRRTDGCRAYTPYAVSAPLHAAALATEMVCDWLQGSPTPCFRTRATANADVFSLKNKISRRSRAVLHANRNSVGSLATSSQNSCRRRASPDHG